MAIAACGGRSIGNGAAAGKVETIDESTNSSAAQAMDAAAPTVLDAPVRGTAIGASSALARPRLHRDEAPLVVVDPLAQHAILEEHVAKAVDGPNDGGH